MYHPPFQMWSRSYVINIKIESYFLLVVSNQLARIWSLCNKRGVTAVRSGITNLSRGSACIWLNQ